VIALKCLIALLFSRVFLFAAGESVVDTSVPWEPVTEAAARAPAEVVKAVRTGDTMALAKAGDTASVLPSRQVSRRDSLIDSLLTTLDSAQSGASEVPPVAGVSGVQERFSVMLQRRIREVAASGVFRIKRHPRIAVTSAAGFTLLLVLFIFLKKRRAEKDEKRFMTTTRLSLMDGEVQRACLHIEKQYMDPSMTPASVCGSIVTGQPFLETMFERELGMSIAAYMDQVRIHHALQIVQWNPTAEAAFIAEHTGYSDAAGFVRQWSSVTGGDFYAYRTERQKSSGGPA
jgi:AraC-like DNA-binding protein